MNADAGPPMAELGAWAKQRSIGGGGGGSPPYNNNVGVKKKVISLYLTIQISITRAYYTIYIYVSIYINVLNTIVMGYLTYPIKLLILGIYRWVYSLGMAYGWFTVTDPFINTIYK
jgi:hypothetical protein